MSDRSSAFTSLLFPSGEEEKERIDKVAKSDLNLDFIIGYMVDDKKKRDLIENYASLLCQDRETINYRLDILDDLLSNQTLQESLADIESHIIPLKYYAGHPGKENSNPLQESVWRLRELEEYLYCIEKLYGSLNPSELSSQGLQSLYEFIEETRKGEKYRELTGELPPFVRKINKIKSLTIGINLNEGLIPFEAALIQVNPFHYERSNFFHKMSLRSGGASSLGPVHTTRETAYYGDPTMVPLFRDLSDILGKAVDPLKENLRTFDRARMLRLIRFSDEFSFYLGAIRLIKRIREMGLPATRPIVREKDGDYGDLQGFYNLELALRRAGRDIVPNDFRSEEGERTFVITGPNNGGKTTFLQGYGIAQYLAQLGLYVPASRAELSICRNIYTHYPDLENPSSGFGRFVEEAKRLTDLVGKLKPRSLVLLNETLSSTNMEEACFIAEDVLEVLASSGSLTLFVTHMHKLAGEGDRPACPVKSLVAQVSTDDMGEISPSFRVIPSRPEGKSYAREIARKYNLGKRELMGLMG